MLRFTVITTSCVNRARDCRESPMCNHFEIMVKFKPNFKCDAGVDLQRIQLLLISSNLLVLNYFIITLIGCL